MTAEQQLERSVLEGKERDELNAIAQAMSLKTTTRTKKADIIDQILDATGVTSGSNGAAAPAETNGSRGGGRSRSAAANGHADAPDASASAAPEASAAVEATAPAATATAE